MFSKSAATDPQDARRAEAHQGECGRLGHDENVVDPGIFRTGRHVILDFEIQARLGVRDVASAGTDFAPLPFVGREPAVVRPAENVEQRESGVVVEYESATVVWVDIEAGVEQGALSSNANADA